MINIIIEIINIMIIAMVEAESRFEMIPTIENHKRH